MKSIKNIICCFKAVDDVLDDHIGARLHLADLVYAWRVCTRDFEMESYAPGSEKFELAGKRVK
jgi:hypothetical protein